MELTNKTRKIIFPRRRNKSKIIESQTFRYKLSAAYVEDALAGRLYTSGLARNIAEKRHFAKWCLSVTSHFVYSTLLFLVVTFHCCLSSFEPVQMVAKATKGINRLAFWGGIVCCVIYSCDVILNMVYSRPRLYFTFTHNKLYFLSIILISIDYILAAAAGIMLFRSFRSALLIFRIQALRNTGLVMMRVTPKFLQFLLIMFGYVTVFAVVGVHLFVYTYVGNDVVKSQHDGIYEGAFNNTGIAILETFVLMTGGSYPRFMIPAYVKHGSAVLIYFVTIIMTGEIMLYALLVARIYDFYVDANIKNVKEERHRERQCLVKAFEILDVDRHGDVHYKHWKGLLMELKPKATQLEIQKRFKKLKELANNDKTQDIADESYWTFNLFEMFYLPSVMQFIVEKTKVQRKVEASPRRYSYCDAMFTCGEWITMICQMWLRTKWAYIFSLAVNIVFVVPFAVVWYGMTQETSKIVYFLEITLLTIMFLSTFMQFIALGVSYILHEMLLHVLMLIIALVCMIYVGVTNVASWSEGWIPIVALLAMVIRLTGFKRKSSSMFHWLRRLAPALLTLLCVTCSAFYTYGILGMECFGGISLCKYGFETLGCSLLTLFQISLGSSWHKVMHYVMDEKDPWTCIYFVFFYALMQMLVLNVISAIVVELSNKIYNDETEAKQRDKEHETKDLLGDTKNFSVDSFMVKKRPSTSSNNAVLTAISVTTNLMTFNGSAFTQNRNVLVKQNSLLFNKMQPRSGQQVHHQITLPCITEEELVVESVDEVTLTGRKELGKWNREILPDITFLNAEDFRRLQAEMGNSVQLMKTKKRCNEKQRPNKNP